MTRAQHHVCKLGAAVRLYGYCPARVLRVYPDPDATQYSRVPFLCDVRVTHRGRGRGFGKGASIGPHGFKPGETLRGLHAADCIPRDRIYISRQSPGRICSYAFNIECTVIAD